MNDYISREWLLDVVENIIKWDTERDRNRAIHQVRELTPAADVRPVVHGKLIHETIDTHSSTTGKFYSPAAICSICGSRVIGNVNYCPNCGADMRKEVPGHE